MNLKSTAIIILTLLIGFVLGALSTGRFVESQVHHLQQLRESPMRDIIGTIEPDEEQMKILEPSIEKYQSEILAINQEHRLLIRSTVDSMLHEIDTLLNETQREKIAKRRQQIKDREKKGLPPPPPPFKLWKRHRIMNSPLSPKPNDSLPGIDSIPDFRPGKHRMPPRPMPLDSAKFRKHIHERLQTPPDTGKLRELHQKRKQGIPFTAEDSVQWQLIRRHIRLHRLYGNDSLHQMPPPPLRNRPRLGQDN